ncbi:hypothetical protein H5410_032780 [Solanum commersonii]|uniref:Uncharacterized protein n=1 Tax=Solanum commersonii TaxID=4109 RepID=A0A9J5YLV6_SOLCO|nr:hypothetical protein H5410_032780 [Solanum commersonii]
MGIFRRLAGLLGFSKDEGHEVRDVEDENVGPHTNFSRKGFSVPVHVPVSRDLPGPILVQCNRGAGGVQILGHDDRFPGRATQPYGTGVWRTIRNLWPKLINKCTIKIGDGGKTLFWEEVWAGQALKASFPELFSLSLQKVATVKEMRDAQGWNLKFRRPLNDWEVNRMVEFLNIPNDTRNSRMRRQTVMGSRYTGEILSGTAYRNSQRTHTQSSYWPWKMIWKVKGLRWYAKRLRIDEDGDVADEFLNEIPPDAPSSTDENNRKFRKFELKYTTKPAKVTSQTLSAAGKIKYRVEYQGKLEWI